MIIYLVLLILIYAALSLQGFPNFAADPGVGWHLKNGQYIFENGIPYTDPFLSIQRPWISDQWLSDLLLNYMQSYLGWEWAYLILTAIFISCFTVILFKACLQFDSSGDEVSANTALGISLAVIVCSRVAMLHFIFRPVIFSFFLFSITFFFLLKFLKQESIKLIHFPILFLIFCLWANIHPSFILGLILIGLSIVSVVISKFFISKGNCLGADKLFPSSKLTTQLIALVLSCSVATLINPYGVKLHQSILQLGSSEYFMKLNNEWLPVDVSSSEGQVTSFIVLSIVFWFLISAKVSINVVFSVVSILFFLYQGLLSIRFLPYFAIASFPLLSTAYSDLQKKFFPVLISPFRGPEFKTYFYFFAFLALILLSTQKLVGNRASSIGISSMRQAVEAVHKSSQQDHNIIYNHPNYGGKLIFFCGNKCKPVLDDRNTLLGEEVYKEFLGMKTWDDARSKLAKYDAKFLLLREKTKLIGQNPLTEIFSEDDFKIYKLN